MEKPKLEHGTRQRYRAGCRCSKCRAAWADYMRDRRRAYGQRPIAQALVDREIRESEERLPELVKADVDAQVNVPLTPLEFQILVNLQKQTGKRRGQVIGQLLRQHPDAADIEAA